MARDLVLWMKEDQGEESWFTTMIDLYRLPSDFPGQKTLQPNFDGPGKVAHLEAGLAADLTARLDGAAIAGRLIPYIQLHEFEALLFSDPQAFSEAFPGEISGIDRLAAIRASVGSPEDIDEGPETCPSKRILKILPDYDKTVARPLIAQRIGLAILRRECGHFDGWLARLLALGNLGAESGGVRDQSPR